MALPTLVDETKSTWGRSDLNSTGLAQFTALVVAKGLTTATCNLTSDTLIFRADGGLWDDTQAAWIPIDKVFLRGSALTPAS